jgi:pimeloyl-ACP methyl ester carboxylesterase
MLICIDGSGPNDDAEYRSAFQHSFLQQALHSCEVQYAGYYRGPDMYGNKLQDPARIARRIQQRHRDGDHLIFLAGYSRGGAVAVEVANELNCIDWEVQALFLFDAVDRSANISSTEFVPQNVRKTYHAARSGAARSRMSFGTTARQARRANSYEERTFLTTHGGMGGVPWGIHGSMSMERSLEYSLLEDCNHTQQCLDRQRWIRDHTYVQEGVDEGLGAALMSFFDPGSRNYFGNYYSSTAGETLVTITAEQTGMVAVRNWMWSNFRRENAL